MEIKDSLFLQPWDRFWVLVYFSLFTVHHSHQYHLHYVVITYLIQLKPRFLRNNLTRTRQQKSLPFLSTSFCAAHSTPWEISNVNFSCELSCQQCLLCNYIKVLNSCFLTKILFLHWKIDKLQLLINCVIEQTIMEKQFGFKN